MVAQQIEREHGEHPIEPAASEELFEADDPQVDAPSKDAPLRVDEDLEDLISAEGELATRRAPVSSLGAAETDTSLDDLLDSFVDEGLADDALAEAEAYGRGAQMARPGAPGPVATPLPPSALAEQSVAAAVQPPDKPAEEPIGVLQPLATPLRVADAPSDAVHQRTGGFWRGLGLVLLGGVLGAALTFLGLLFRLGTLDYASRSQLDALSNNMNTMQANQELTWQRANEVDPRLAAQDAQIVAMEQKLATAQQQAEAAQAEAAGLSQEVTALREQLTTALEETETRMDALEGQAATLDESVTALKTTVSPLQAAVERFNGFFTQMRDLLIRLQGTP